MNRCGARAGPTPVLDARGGSFLSAQARFVTTDGSEYEASLERVGGGDATTALRREGQPVTCRGLAGRVVSAKDR